MKTSLKVDIESIRPYREIIKLMKLWKVQHGISCKTFVIEQLVRRAIGNQLATDYSNAIGRVLGFIATNIKTVRLVDPANSNNITPKTPKHLAKRQRYHSINQIFLAFVSQSCSSDRSSDGK